MSGSLLVAALAGPAASLLVGVGLVVWIPELRRLPLAPRLGVSYLLGAAGIGVAAFVLSWVGGVPLRSRLFLALALAALLSVVARLRRGRAPSSSSPRRATALENAFLAVLVVGTVGLIGAALRDPVLDFDGRMTWGVQARFLRHDATVLPEALRDERVFVVHPRYPVLLPILQVVSVELGGVEWEEAPVQVLYALFLPALALTLVGLLRPTLGAPAAVAGTAAVLFTPALCWGIEGGARSTYSDLPLAAFLGAALLLSARGRLSRAGGAALGLLLAAVVLAKQEGAVLAGALALAGVVLGRSGSGRRGPRLVAAAGCALALVGWLVWRGEIPNRNDEGYLEDLLAGVPIAALAARAPDIARGVWSALGDVRSWGLLWLLVPWAALVHARDWTRCRAGRLALLLLAAQAALILLAYASAPRLDVVAATAGRFAIQAAAPLALLLGLAVRSARRRARGAPRTDARQ